MLFKSLAGPTISQLKIPNLSFENGVKGWPIGHHEGQSCSLFIPNKNNNNNN